MDTKLVLVLGAGATYAESPKSPSKYVPPLDKDFFSSCNHIYPDQVNEIKNYFLNNYHRDIFNEKNDSFEQIMSTVYTDIFDPRMKKDASKTFVLLIKLFNKRLADSTNKIKINSRRQLYRVVTKYLEAGYNPKNIAFITFNQDIQIERTLDFINNIKRWKKLEIFSFPRCYSLDMAGMETTGPSNKNDCFYEPDDLPAKIKIYKLHGSLNWFSAHDSEEFNPELFFDPTRRLKITRRRKLYPDMRYSNPAKPFSLPVIIPPVNNKSSVMHNKLKLLWINTENILKKANEIIFWGYSLPDLDFESKNLFTRNMKDNPKLKKVSVINPDSSVVKKFIDMLELNQLCYYSDANRFISDYFN